MQFIRDKPQSLLILHFTYLIKEKIVFHMSVNVPCSSIITKTYD